MTVRKRPWDKPLDYAIRMNEENVTTNVEHPVLKQQSDETAK